MGFTEAIIAGVLMLMPATAEASTWKERSIECLALNMYHEARDQGIPVRHKCQFSWYCDGKSDEPKDTVEYKKTLDLSKMIMDNAIQVIDITDGALFYHADYVTPSWAKIKQKTTEIGDHIFYKWEEK